MLRVRATKTGFWQDSRMREGVEFNIPSIHHFSTAWMEPVGWKYSPEEKLAAPKPVEIPKKRVGRSSKKNLEDIKSMKEAQMMNVGGAF